MSLLAVTHELLHCNELKWNEMKDFVKVFSLLKLSEAAIFPIKIIYLSKC